MSSPATIAETSDNATPGNTLLIIPDGSSLWTAPQSDNQDETVSPTPNTTVTQGGSFTVNPVVKLPTPICWQIDALTAFTNMLASSTIGRTIPALISAPGRTAERLFHPNHDVLQGWSAYAAAKNLRITIRFSLVESGRQILGSKDPDADAAELWFVTDDDLYNGGNLISCRSDGWTSVLRRLGFDVRHWSGSQSLTENLAPTNGDGKRLPARVRNALPGSNRPTSITVGTFVDRELVTTEYPLNS